MKKSVLVIFLLCFVWLMPAQPWMRYLPAKSKANPSFYQIQQAFTKWEKDKQIRNGYIYKDGKRIKAAGWKQFKRWEYIWESRVDRNGYFLPPTYLLNQWQTFKRSQKITLQADWHLLGPMTKPPTYTGQPNGLGRINAVVFDPQDTNTFYVCTASGGLWRTNDYGRSWTYLSMALPTLGTSDALVDYTNSNVIYLATGDRDHYDAQGLGIWKSVDYGQTWQRVLDSDMTVNVLVMDPHNHLKIIAGATFGVYITEDGGQTWTQTLSDVRIKDIELHPTNAQIIYATGEGYLFKSNDGGNTWIDITDRLNLPVLATRNVLGVSPAQPDWLYVLATNDNGDASSPFLGLYLSKDAGETFSLQTNQPNILGYYSDGSDNGSQAWYDLCIAVDPNNASVVYTGGVNIWKSVNAGKTMTIRAHWTGQNAPAVHADHHDLRFAPDGQTLFSCNDGGIYYTQDGGLQWNDITSGLSIAQVYRIGSSASEPFLFMNGFQDNGSALAQAPDQFLTVIGGDGMECIIDYSDDRYKFGEIYFGQVYRSIDNGSFRSITDAIDDQGYWVTPYMLGYDNPKRMLVGMSDLWMTDDVRKNTVSWNRLTSFFDSDPIISLDMRAVFPHIVYFAKKSGRLFRLDNLSGPLTELTDNLPFQNIAITSIETDDDNANVVYITIFDRDSRKSLVLRSNDKGLTWTDITSNLPNVYFNCIVRDTTSQKNALYLGTFTGVFYTNDQLGQWIDFSNGLPITDVRELEIFYGKNPADKHIKAATFGRGTWYSHTFAENNTDAAVFIGGEKDICLNQPIYVNLINLGIDTLTSAMIYVYLQGQLIDSIQWTGSLPIYEQDSIILTDLTKMPGTYNLLVKVTNPNGKDDDYSGNNTYQLTYDINIAKPDYNENFADGILPSCWQRDNWWQMTARDVFDFQAETASNGYPYVQIDTGEVQASLVSSPFDFGAISQAYIGFYQILNIPEGKASLQYSEDGKIWQDIYVFQGKRGNAVAPDVFMKDISFLQGKEPVYFRFNFSASGPAYWAIDDFYIKRVLSEQGITDAVLVYPNPAKSILNISFRQEYPEATLRLLTVDGKVIYYSRVKTPQFISIPVDNLNSGLYIVDIILPQNHIVKKILVQ